MNKTALLILVLAAGVTAGFGLQRILSDHENRNRPAEDHPP
jgi:hypothetical protein